MFGNLSVGKISQKLDNDIDDEYGILKIGKLVTL